MIIDFLLTLLAAGLKAGANGLPNGQTLDTSWAGAYGNLLHSALGLDGVLPISPALTCLSIAVAYLGLSYGFRIVDWVWHHIPVVGAG